MWCSTCPHTARSKEPSPKGKRRAVVHDARRRAAHPALGAVDVDEGDVGVGAEGAAQDARGVTQAAAEVQVPALPALPAARRACRNASQPLPSRARAMCEKTTPLRFGRTRGGASTVHSCAALRRKKGASASTPLRCRPPSKQRASDYRPRRIDGVQRVRKLGRVRCSFVVHPWLQQFAVFALSI